MIPSYPHVDIGATGRRTAQLLQRIMSGDIQPCPLRFHCPMREDANGARTELGSMVERHATARTYETRKRVYAIGINGAFPYADIVEVGPGVLMTFDADTADYREIAETPAHDIWTHRHEVLNSHMTSAKTAEIAQGSNAHIGPLIIVEYADYSGSGVYGDATGLLSAFWEKGVRNACLGPLTVRRQGLI